MVAEKRVRIDYFNHRDGEFVPFFKGTEDLAREFMTLHGRLHRLYRIYIEEENAAPAQREAAAAV